MVAEMDDVPAFTVGRVVVALDAQCDHGAAIATACEFAGRWRCAVAGVFVVGADLVHLSGLPGVRQVCLSSGVGQALPGGDLAADIAALEARARRALAAAADRIGQQSTFSVARGGLAAEGVDLAGDDLLIVEATVRPFGGSFAFETRWRQVAAAARHAVLLRRRRSMAAGTVACLHDGSAASGRALAAAAGLADDRGQPLAVLLAPDLPAGAEAGLSSALAGRRPPARIQRVGPGGDAAWVRAGAALRPALIVVAADLSTDRWAGVPEADVLLVR
ncbi:hypothetical protein EDC65_5403 [Stella humosa]|uniref:Universal stress protein family protein n=1 Tax=Stella humosa TaxID=94 RepID=A0A3N1KRV0_9PROT|nr:hypothetical protein [Stella humosa]ROP81068.1 hypothetical protein EDC65_5403 [Stella humosa]BBK29758.1 hypothetical protein STHU_03920 [Stella humosa]